jgi:hypothetical protein
VPLPATLAIVEPDDPTSQVHIRITAFQDANPGAKARVVRDVLTTVPHQRTVLLDIPLSFLDDGSGVGTLPAQYVPFGSGVSSGTASEGTTQFDPTDPSNIQTPLCDFTQGLTSVYGQCVGALLVSSTLPAYDGADAGTQAQDAGGCFDVTTCFAGATLVGDVNSCSFSLAQGVDASNLNLALATSTTGACIASIDECLVPLAEDPNAGWTVSGGTVTLAPGACSKAQQVGVQLFQATSGACPAMALTTLVCEPTSPNGGGSLPEGGDATVADAGDATVEAEAGFLDAGFDATVDGGMSCPTGQTLCGSACVKEQTDSNNCGSCGHYCQGGTCSGGQCQPIALATMQTVPWTIAARAGTVYWADRSENVSMLLSVPAGGGTISTLVSPLPGSPSNIALDSTHVYWGGSDTIMSVGLDGGTPQTLLASGAGFALCLAVDANNVYWTTQGPCPSDGGVCAAGSVFELPLDGGTPFTLASGQLNPGGITVDQTHVYWVDDGNGTSNGAVMSVAIDGGGLVPLAQGLPTNYAPAALLLPDINGIAVDSTGVYFTTWDGVSQGAVLKVPLTGGTPTTLATSTGTFLYGLAVDSSGVYFSDEAIQTVPLDGGVTVTIASGQIGAFAIAVDSTSVYWTILLPAADGGAATGSVLQVAKP